MVDIDTQEVSLVDRAANKRKFILFKSEGGVMKIDEMVLKAILEGDLPLAEKLKSVFEGWSEKAVGAFQAVMKLLGSYKDELPADALTKSAEVLKEMGFELPTVEKVVTKEVEKGAKPTWLPVKKDDGSYDLSSIPEESRPMVEMLLKSYDGSEDEIKKLNEKLEKAADEQATKEAVAKAATFTHIPELSAEEFAPVIKALSGADFEAWAKVESILKAANKVIEDGELLKQFGKDGIGESEAERKLDSMAKERVTKSAGEKSYEQAYTEILDENPDLYAQAKRESASA